jgi:hypothetical protein
MKKILSAVASLILLLMPIVTMSGQEADREKMSKDHQRVYDASLALYGEEGQVAHFLCTSTVVAERPGEYLLLTAGHCIVGDGLPADLKFFVSEQIVDEPAIGNANLQPVEVVRAQNDDKYDFAILYLKSDKHYPVIPLRDPNKVPKIEDKVYTVNFSMGVAKQVALGQVATDVITNKGSDGECSICPGRYMVHLFAAPGASGAAIVDEKSNEIIGIGEFGFPGQTMGLGCETMAAFLEWVNSPIPVKAPKAWSLKSSEVWNSL